jgi:uncharacterized repeat protein (TIGR03803 family)
MRTSIVKLVGAHLSAALLAGCGGNAAIATTGFLPASTEPFGVTSRLTPLGSYRERVLVRFAGAADGRNPTAGLIADAEGALYGTTFLGGSGNCPYGCGGVFKLTPSGKGYQKSILWNFRGSPGDGANPSAGLIADGNGAFYGTTALGGTYCCGTVFKLTPSATGYTEQILWSFNGIDGSGPGPLTFAKGALYGATIEGGVNGDAGTVFTLTPSTSGYAEHVLWNFGNSSTDGVAPGGSVTVDKAGAVYGTTGAGGNMACSCGTVFKLTPRPSKAARADATTLGDPAAAPSIS